MNRAIKTACILLILTGLSVAALAENVPVRILIGSREATVVPPAVWDGQRVLAPLGIISTLGGSYIASQESGKITVMTESGASQELQYQDVDGTPMIAVDDVLKVVGGESVWDADARTLTLISHVQSIEYVDNTLKVNCSFPVSYKAHFWTDKLILDMDNAKVGTEAKEVFIDTPEVWRARLGEPGENTARVVIDLKRMTGYRFDCAPVASKILMKIGDGESGAQVGMPQAGPVGEIRVDTIDHNQFNVVISTAGKVKVDHAYGVKPPQIVLNLTGVTLNPSDDFSSAHPLLKNMRCSWNDGRARVEINPSRIVAYNVNVRDGMTVVNVRTPDRSGGTLADKFFVIDPGHGGSDAGARSNGVKEKDLNLKIAQELVAALQQAGARVQLTRNTDVAVDLKLRPNVALGSNADFFISVHCNSVAKANTANGIETYYHMYEGSPQALAFAVQAGMISATGMFNRGAQSDSARYRTGFAVLRGLQDSGLPGVLLECGFVNHSSDRARLVDPAFRKKLVGGVMAGLRAYVEGTPLD